MKQDKKDQSEVRPFLKPIVLNIGNASVTTKQHSATTNSQKIDSSPTPNKITIVAESPKVMRRPLMLIDGRGYAAARPFVQVEQSETIDERGNVTPHNPPKIIKKRLLVVIRDDGQVFYEGQSSFGQLGFSVELPELPREEKLFSEQGITRFESGERPISTILFEQLCEVLDTFIDFNQSISTQREMCELIACFIMATWFVEAFNVVPFLWLNGDKGSGKSQLLNLISLQSFLGQQMLSSGSFASLRDHADNGACLCFDEAENLSHPKTDPSKREIYLAGNRRGSTVTLKRLGKDNKWENQYVNMFCPRVFAAIERPDAVLASRSIIIPLVRTMDRKKGNADIWEFSHWPHDLRKLIDDLWAVALANIHQMPSYDSKVKETSPLTGRTLEPWRAILAVAHWLERNGLNGLAERMNKLSLEYQKQRETVETEDLNALIIRAICGIIGCEVVRLGELSEVGNTSHFIPTGDIERHALSIALQMDLDIDEKEITSRIIGRKLSQQRFEKKRQGGTGKYGWIITIKRLHQWSSSIGLLKPDEDEAEGVTS